MPEFILQHLRKKAMPRPDQALLKEKLAYQRSQRPDQHRQMKVHT